MATAARSCRSIRAAARSRDCRPIRRCARRRRHRRWRFWPCRRRRPCRPCATVRARGVQAVVVLSSGFAEAGDAGLRLQEELVDIARRCRHPAARAQLPRHRQRAERHDRLVLHRPGGAPAAGGACGHRLPVGQRRQLPHAERRPARAGREPLHRHRQRGRRRCRRRHRRAGQGSADPRHPLLHGDLPPRRPVVRGARPGARGGEAGDRAEDRRHRKRPGRGRLPHRRACGIGCGHRCGLSPPRRAAGAFGREPARHRTGRLPADTGPPAPGRPGDAARRFRRLRHPDGGCDEPPRLVAAAAVAADQRAHPRGAAAGEHGQSGGRHCPGIEPARCPAAGAVGAAGRFRQRCHRAVPVAVALQPPAARHIPGGARPGPRGPPGPAAGHHQPGAGRRRARDQRARHPGVPEHRCGGRGHAGLVSSGRLLGETAERPKPRPMRASRQVRHDWHAGVPQRVPGEEGAGGSRPAGAARGDCRRRRRRGGSAERRVTRWC